MGLQQFDGFMVHLGGLHVRRIEWNRDYATVERHAPLGDGAVSQADNRQARANARGNQRRVAGGGHAGNGAYAGQMVGGVHGGERNGFIDPLEAFMDAVAGGLSNALPLGT